MRLISIDENDRMSPKGPISAGFVIECVADFDIGDGYFMNDFVMLKKY